MFFKKIVSWCYIFCIDTQLPALCTERTAYFQNCWMLWPQGHRNCWLIVFTAYNIGPLSHPGNDIIFFIVSSRFEEQKKRSISCLLYLLLINEWVSGIKVQMSIFGEGFGAVCAQRRGRGGQGAPSRPSQGHRWRRLLRSRKGRQEGKRGGTEQDRHSLQGQFSKRSRQTSGSKSCFSGI